VVAPTDEDREAGERGALGRGEQVVAPRDRRSQGSLALVGVAAPADEDAEPAVDPAFVSYRPTPNEPAYSSGLATVSGAISRVLAHAFPSEVVSIEQAEADAEISRLYDGTHYEHDIAAGAAVGHAIGRVYVARGRCERHGDER
jgi:hypothetical protein